MTAEWDDLARLAEAATPGPWEADHSEEDNSAVKQEGRAWWDGLAFCGRPADAEFIAAANPATILRLIAENRRLTHLLGSHADGHRCTCTMTRPAQFTHEYGPEPAEWEQDPWCPTHPDVDQIRSEFDALAARLAVVEALLADGPDTWRPYQVREAGDVFMADEVTEFTADLRAVLSAAPTDTTKEGEA